MSIVRVRRKTKARTALGIISEAVQEQTLRKSLSILQPAADDPSSLVGYGGTPTSRKVEKSKPVVESKENSPMKTRRSKRKTTVQSSVEAKVASSTPVTNNTKKTDDGLKQQTLTKYSKKLAPKLGENLAKQEDYHKEISEHPEARLSGISIPSESSGYFSDNAEKHEGSFKSGTEGESKSSVENAGNEDQEGSAMVPNELQHSPSIPKDVHDLLISDTVPETYWKELAEQRRLALEETLHENELLRDQLEVLEAEYSRLKQIVDDAEGLTQVVKDILDG